MKCYTLLLTQLANWLTSKLRCYQSNFPIVNYKTVRCGNLDNKLQYNSKATLCMYTGPGLEDHNMMCYKQA